MTKCKTRAQLTHSPLETALDEQPTPNKQIKYIYIYKKDKSNKDLLSSSFLNFILFFSLKRLENNDKETTSSKEFVLTPSGLRSSLGTVTRTYCPWFEVWEDSLYTLRCWGERGTGLCMLFVRLWHAAQGKREGLMACC